MIVCGVDVDVSILLPVQDCFDAIQPFHFSRTTINERRSLSKKRAKVARSGSADQRREETKPPHLISLFEYPIEIESTVVVKKLLERRQILCINHFENITKPKKKRAKENYRCEMG
jgi:hypothetical protein